MVQLSPRFLVAPLLSGLVCASCVGAIGDDESSGPGIEVPVDADSLAPTGQRRLTRTEYERTLRDLVGDESVDAAAVQLAGLPSDEVEDGFTTMASDVNAAYVESTFRLADAIGSYIATDATRRSELEPCLGDAAPSAQCIEDLAIRFGRRAWRRPLGDAEIDAIVETYTLGTALTPEDGVHLVLVHLLSAPPFLYRLEIDGEETKDDEIFTLTSFELATRLSYAVWGSGPDDALLDAAASGDLESDEGVEGELERMLADPRARARAGLFFREWMRLDQVATPQHSPEFLDGIDATGLPALAAAELERFALHQSFDADGDVHALFSARDAFVDSQALAQIYGIEMGEGVLLPPERAGVVGRVAMLLDVGETTHPIRRGALVRKRLLCDTIEVPDPSDLPPDALQPPPFDANKTARERWTDKTSQATCAACHTRINAIGFALEGFDTLGRSRQMETIFDPSGELVNELPIDTKVEVDLGDGEPVSVDGGSGLALAMAESETVATCFSRQWLRYSAGRVDGVEDEDLIDVLVEAGDGAGGLRALFAALPRQPGFRFHRIQP